MAKAQSTDEWDVKVLESNEKEWSSKTSAEKVLTVVIYVAKGICVLLLLYLFILSLGLMGNAFKILGGKTAGKTFRENEIFDNPIAGLVLGVLATVLVQSSSTSTSIIITMTAANLIEVKNAIPMIMGANIGTSVTNTIVSLAQVGNRDEYRRAFAGATVHDCFNLLTVAVLLPIEIICGLLKGISVSIVEATLEEDTEKSSKQDFLKKLTKPISSRLVQVDKKLVTKVANAETQEDLEELMEKSMIVQSRTKDNHLFMDTPMSDDVAGWLLLIVSLVFLTTCLSLLVTLLQTIFRGRAAIWMQRLLNLEFKSVPFVGDYILVLFGIGITILMQSSSITTSTLTPLVGVGLIKLEKMFPFTVGANIGTTITGILSALASSNIYIGMQVALAHLFFNLIGTLIWFPWPPVRRIPLAMAKFLGSLAADWPWFPLAYILIVFAVLPAFLFLLSIAGVAACIVGLFFVMMCVCGPILLHVLRQTRQGLLPPDLRKNHPRMPQVLRTPNEEDDTAAPSAVTGAASAETQDIRGPANADLDSATLWWQAPFVWGLAWAVILMVVSAVPNGQWANMKYAKFDKREHVGFGAWSACSSHYKKDMAWASAPDCTSAEATECWDWHMSSCDSDKDGANKKYEKSWENCTSHFKCTPAQWESACLAGSCDGSLHDKQCKNLTKAVTFEFAVSYEKAGSVSKAWEAGEVCRPLSDVCDNSSNIGHAGNLASVGLVFTCIGQILLLSYLFRRLKQDMSKCLVAATANFVLAWIMLLASWATFARAVSGDATCVIVDVTTRKAALAKGSFGTIINAQGSYCYAFIIFSWILLTCILPLLAQRMLFDMKHPFSSVTQKNQGSTSGEQKEAPSVAVQDTSAQKQENLREAEV